jgi:hypothetical protein
MHAGEALVPIKLSSPDHFFTGSRQISLRHLFDIVCSSPLFSSLFFSLGFCYSCHPNSVPRISQYTTRQALAGLRAPISISFLESNSLLILISIINCGPPIRQWYVSLIKTSGTTLTSSSLTLSTISVDSS